MNDFKKLGLDVMLLKALEKMEITEPTEIQLQTIPKSLEGKDLIACSATGSGKTLAFGACIAQNSFRGKGIQSLILTPTRELAVQVSKEFRKFSKHKFLNVVSVYGGVAINPQMDKLKSADVVVGTPGRILDHLNRRTIDFSNVQTFVLDEADRMLDMGFIDDIESIIKTLPKKRQTLLFSATIDGDVSRIAKKYMDAPEKIDLDNRVDPSKLTQIYYDVPNNLKFSLLTHLLKNDESKLSMVFCNTQRNTDFVAKNLRKNGIDAIAIHGGFTQAKRSKTMQDFYSGNFTVLVCTDVAARGLDIKNVSNVYNYDIPAEAKQYVHRIGRTARAGENGIAVNILSERDHDNFRKVLSGNDFKIEKTKMPYVDRVVIQAQDSGRDRSGSRNSRDGRSGDRRSRDNNRSGGNRRSGDRKPRSDDRRSSDKKPRSGDRKSGDKKPRSGDRKSGDRRSGDKKPGDRKSSDRRSGRDKSKAKS